MAAFIFRIATLTDGLQHFAVRCITKLSTAVLESNVEQMLLRTFQQQLLLQCLYVIEAAKDINKHLQERNIDLLFGAVQNLLNAGANISKTLWGSAAAKVLQRKPLRDSIGIGDGSPLRAVAMRNNFEHMDERIDRWWNEDPTHCIADCMVGPPGIIGGLSGIQTFRHFNPETTDVIFWGETFNIQAVVNEVTKILPALRREASKPHWE